MTEHSLWRFSRALHRAINDRQFDEIEPLIDEDVDWTIYGPVDMLPFLGSRRGKDAVIDVIQADSDGRAVCGEEFTEPAREFIIGAEV